MRRSIPRLFTVLLILLPALPLTFPLPSHAQTVNVALPDTFVTETGPILLPVTISDVTGLGILSFDISISFDSTIVDVLQVELTNSIAEGYFMSSLDQPSRIFIAAAGTAPLAGAGVLLYLRVRFLQDGASEMNFDKVSFEVDSVDVVARNGRLRNISLAGTEHTARMAPPLATVVFPNPFSKHTTLSMDLPEAAQVSISLYNIHGQRMRSYPPRPVAAGANQLIPIDVSSLPAGPYFYSIQAQSAGVVRYGTGVMTKIH